MRADLLLERGGVTCTERERERERERVVCSMCWLLCCRGRPRGAVRRQATFVRRVGVVHVEIGRTPFGWAACQVAHQSQRRGCQFLDDLSFKLEYVHPYLDGMYSPRNRTFRTSCFNTRKLSPVFTGGPGMDEVPPIWIDRVGFKSNITENLTRQSKFTYGLVMEEITTRDETSSICTNGTRALPSGGLNMNGPPTTLSGTGIDRMAFAQANITRDNTKFVNGAIVGERNVFQLDQGLGIGSKFPIFNRHQLTITQFLQLKQVEEGAGKPPPPVLVLHGHYGGCVGDLPGYDAFTLGGPYSVRGYNMGELGACRNILELAAELRIPVRNTHVYVFAEHGNDLGSSKDVKGNPTEFFRRMGHGSSYGAGVKLGMVRAEYAVDHNAGTGAVFFRFGERF